MQTLEEKQQDGMTGAGPETEFHTELFGFNRVEVLSYIERISAANAEKARALEDTIAALQKDLTGVRRQGSTLAQKAKQVFNELENQKNVRRTRWQRLLRCAQRWTRPTTRSPRCAAASLPGSRKTPR